MSARLIFGMINNVSRIIHALEARGMRIEVGDDFTRYHTLRHGCQGRSRHYPVFDTASSFIDETNGFWICGFGESGALIYTHAVRLFDLTGKSLGQHLDTHRHKFIAPDTTPDPDLTFYRGPMGLRTISGKVAYSGDFWLQDGALREENLDLLSDLLFAVLQQTWPIDYAVALAPKRFGADAARLRYAYTHCEPGRWIGPDQQITSEDYLVWMSAAEIDNMLLLGNETQTAHHQKAMLHPSILTADAKG